MSHNAFVRLHQMRPLDIHLKNNVEELEPIDLEVTEKITKTQISFNEELVVCSFQTSLPPTSIQRSVQQLRKHPQLKWINPILEGFETNKSKSPSILKRQSYTSLSETNI